jgi:hypothetical protein
MGKWQPVRTASDTVWQEGRSHCTALACSLHTYVGLGREIGPVDHGKVQAEDTPEHAVPGRVGEAG